MTPETEALIARVLAHDAEMHGPLRVVGPYSGGAFLDSGYLIAAENMHEPDHSVGDDGSEPLHGPRCGFDEVDARGLVAFRTDAPKLARMLKQAIGALCLTVTVKDSGGALTALRETTLAEIEKIAREGA